MRFAHFCETVLAAPKVVAFWSSWTAFQIFTIEFVARQGYPGTGGRTSPKVTDLVDLTLCLSLKRLQPRGFIDCFDFQIVTAVIDATASFRHFKWAFWSTSSERTLSDSLVLWWYEQWLWWLCLFLQWYQYKSYPRCSVLQGLWLGKQLRFCP